MKYFLEKPAGGLARIGDLDSQGSRRRSAAAAPGACCARRRARSPASSIKLYAHGTEGLRGAARAESAQDDRGAAADLQCGGKLRRLAWPQAAVRDANGKFRGFLMPKVGAFGSTRCCSRCCGATPDTSEAMFFRLSLARSLATLIDALHQTGYCVIDLKPENVRVARAGAFGREGAVGLIDTDGFAFSGTDGIAFAAGFATEEYLYPRILNFERDVPRHAREQDRWALAVPSSNSSTTTSIHCRASITPQFETYIPPRCSSARASNPRCMPTGSRRIRMCSRPPAVCTPPSRRHCASCSIVPSPADWIHQAPAEWVALLAELAHPRQRCRRDRHHWRYGERCGACALKGRATTHPTTKTPRRRPAGEQTAGHHQAEASTGCDATPQWAGATARESGEQRAARPRTESAGLALADCRPHCVGVRVCTVLGGPGRHRVASVGWGAGVTIDPTVTGSVAACEPARDGAIHDQLWTPCASGHGAPGDAAAARRRAFQAAAAGGSAQDRWQRADSAASRRPNPGRGAGDPAAAASARI